MTPEEHNDLFDDFFDKKESTEEATEEKYDDLFDNFFGKKTNTTSSSNGHLPHTQNGKSVNGQHTSHQKTTPVNGQHKTTPPPVVKRVQQPPQNRVQPPPQNRVQPPPQNRVQPPPQSRPTPPSNNGMHQQTAPPVQRNVTPPPPVQRPTAPPQEVQEPPRDPNATPPTIVRSEEVHEILTKIPNWIIRWGITLIFIILGAIILMSYFIKYPDVVEGAITLTAGNPPAPIVTKSSGSIDLFADDGAYIKERQVFAYLKSATNFDDVVILNRRLKTLKQELNTGNISTASWPDLELGQIQSAYNNLVFRIKENQNLSQTTANNNARKQNIDQQIREVRNLMNQQKQSIELLKQEYLAVKQSYDTRYQPLFQSGVISANELEQKERELMQRKSAYQNAQSSLNEYNNRILGLESQKTELDFSKTKESTNNQNAITDAYSTLVNAIKEWEERFLLRTPIAGKINYLQFVKDNSFVQQGQEIASIVPESAEGSEIVGELFVPARGTGKIQEGQQVNIELDDYIKKEYGMVKGNVRSISDVGTKLADGIFAYKIYVDLPEGLRTKSEKPMTFRHNMTGKAEVITEDVRLISRIFNEIKGIFDDF